MFWKNNLYLYYINWFIPKGIAFYLCLYNYVSTWRITTIHLLKVVRSSEHAIIIDLRSNGSFYVSPLKWQTVVTKASDIWCRISVFCFSKKSVFQKKKSMFCSYLYHKYQFFKTIKSDACFLSQNISLSIHKLYFYSLRTIPVSDAIVCVSSWNKC